MATFQFPQFVVVKRLNAQADSVHAMLGQHVQLAGRDVFRVGFDAPFRIVIHKRSDRERFRGGVQMGSLQVRGCSAAEKNGFALAGDLSRAVLCRSRPESVRSSHRGRRRR